MSGNQRVLGALSIAALVVAMIGGCGDPESASAATDDSRATAKAKAERQRTDPPPDDWVRVKCELCSCRVFSGDEPYCKRPSCRHHWSDHKSKLTG